MAANTLAARPRAAERTVAPRAAPSPRNNPLAEMAARVAAPSILRRIVQAFEPWYDWGRINFSRLDAVETDFSDESTGEGRYFEIQWFGLHLQVTVGIVPPKLSAAEVRANKALLAKWAAEREQEA